jgi:GTP-binding protein
VERQIDQAVRQANVILLLVDVRDGVTTLDREVAARLRERSKEIPLILVANKVDASSQENLVGEFYALGLGEPVPISALHHRGTKALLDRVVEKVWPTGDVDVDPVMKLAVVGRQNVGKSTFVNAIAQEERVIVSEVPGTTRDAVDVHFEKDGRRFVVIDTAGAKKISRAKHAIEVFSQFRTENAIRRADVVLLLLDASQEITRIDKNLGDFIARESKVCIIVANKWDLVREASTTERYAEYLNARFPLLGYAPVVFTTAKDSRNIQSTLDLAQHLFKKAIRRVNTGEVNRVIEAAGEHRMPRSKGKRVPKILYGTQVAISPPTFVIFVNDPRLFPEDYRRYLERAFREALRFDEIPLRLFFRGRDRTKAESKQKPGKARKGEGRTKPTAGGKPRKGGQSPVRGPGRRARG